MRLRIYGVVQGVGFRPCVYNIAVSMGLNGYVRNNGSNVEVVLDGDHGQFITSLKEKLPPLARIERIEVEPLDKGESYRGFDILFSKSGSRSSVIPADTAVCLNCLGEFNSPDDRRYLYPFTNCTDCGARYSLIADVPYDRDKTSMDIFKMCPQCLVEYRDPSNRRFHAQTTCCPRCGPAYSLYNGHGKILSRDQVSCFKKYADALARGKVGVMKSWGGMHICSSLSGVKRLRELYSRPQKPFALMMRDISTVKNYTNLSPFQEELLCSHQRPIVLLEKKDVLQDISQGIPENVSPGLDTVGVMLPYSPAHHMFFKYYPHDVIVATSANTPGDPICIDNQGSFKLGLDIYLLHDRPIVQRVDDTVLRTFGTNRFFIRRSRGFVPDPLPVDYGETIISVGAQENVSASLSRESRLYTSQYVGNTEHYDTEVFLDEAIEHMCRLLGVTSADVVARDMHPAYSTRRVAARIASEMNCGMVDIQHHHAHAASLALDGSVDEPIVALALDGSGYGPDGTIWGGEILESTFASYKRVARLQHIPLVGGEKAIKDIRRLVFALGEMSGRDGEELVKAITPTEAKIFRKMLPRSVGTSSMGRVLDALSFHLDVARSRSYSGEPAMKLERYLAQGKKEYDFDFPIGTQGDCSVIETLGAFDELFDITSGDSMDHRKRSGLAHSFLRDLVDEMTHLACRHALASDLKYVGLTGGVSYNTPITTMVGEVVGRYSELELLLHNNIPNGDGGISVGQNIIAGTSMQ